MQVNTAEGPMSLGPFFFRPHRLRFAVVVSTLAVVALLLMHVSPSLTEQKEARNVVTPAKKALVSQPLSLDFGQVSNRGAKTLSFQVVNPSPSPIEVTTIETSCDCLEVSIPNRIVPARSTVDATARINLDKDSTFRGDLAITAKGLTASKAIIFDLTCFVTAQ